MVLMSKELLGVTIAMLGFRVHVRGRHHIAEAERLGAVGVFNHVAWLDAFLLVWLMAPSGVSKASNADLPVIKHAIRALNTVFIPYDKLSKGPNGARSSGSTGADARGKRGDGASSQEAPGAPGGHAGKAAEGARTRAGAGGSGSSRGVEGGGSDPTPDRDASSSSSVGSISSDGSGGGPGAAATVTLTPSPLKGATPSPTPAPARTTAPPAPAPPPRKDAFIVSSRVTEVLLQRVHDPCYCRPGGYPLLVMAPEGTTSNGRGLLEFRTGAFALRRPVLPICLRYGRRGHNPAWTIGNERWHFVRLMCQIVNEVEVVLLPPYVPSEEELREPKLYASNVRRAMGAALGVPLVAASHDDYLALRRLGVGVSWDGRRVLAPPGVVGADGTIDLGKSG